jgi:membrane-bound ClpP family serine protease
MNKRLTRTRLILAILSTAAQEAAIWVIWEILLPHYGANWPWQALAAVMTVWAAFGTWLFIFTTNIINKRAEAGLTSMVGITGEVTDALNPEGQIKIKGERWRAISEEGEIETGEEVVVVAERRLLLTVRRARH